MNKQEQKRYLKECLTKMQRIVSNTRYSAADIEDAPKSVRAAQDRIDAAEKIVARWRDRESKNSEKTADAMQKDLAALKRSFAFNEPEETLKLWDRLVRKYPTLAE